MRKPCLNIFFFIGLSIFLCAACTLDKKPNKALRLAHGLDINHSAHLSMEHMARVLDSISNGALTIKIYPSQQLGTERECLELLQIGSLDITKVSAAVLENFAPELKILSLPYIFSSKAHQQEILDSNIGDSLLGSCKPYRLAGLCFYDAGSRNFYTRDTPIQTPSDLSGLKIRVQESATAIAMVRALGGSPTPISWGELYTALQQGVVDGAENNAPSFYLSRHYEICRHYTLSEHTMVPDVIIIATATLSRLTAEEQTWIKIAAKASAMFQRKLWNADEAKAIEALKENGVQIITPDKGVFSEKTETLLNVYKSDSTIAPYINAIIYE